MVRAASTHADTSRYHHEYSRRERKTEIQMVIHKDLCRSPQAHHAAFAAGGPSGRVNAMVVPLPAAVSAIQISPPMPLTKVAQI